MVERLGLEVLYKIGRKIKTKGDDKTEK